MQRRLILVVGVLLVSLASGCIARSRIGKAIVQQDASGQLCFAIEDTAATRDGRPMLQSITVSTQGNAQAASRKAWSFMIEPRSLGLAISGAHCVPYGNMPSGMKLLTEASPLQPGVLYVVSVHVRLADPDDPTQVYQGRFCLIPGSSVPRVHEVLWDAQTGKWLSEPCFVRPDARQ